MAQSSPFKIFATTQSKYLGHAIAKSYGSELGKHTLYRFSDGEFQPAFDESVRGCTCFIVGSTFQPTDNLMELLLLIDAAKRASAYKVIAVIPYFGFARQERKDKPRAAIGAKLVANMIQAAGADRVMTMDLHAAAIQGFFDIPVDHLYASSVFIPHLTDLNISNLAIAAPDMGGAKRAKAYASFLNAEMVICYKSRKKANEIEQYKVIGEIEGRNIIIIDDMIDTAGTVCIASDMMMEEGAESVRVVATHGVLSGAAYERIEKSSIKEVIVSDTIPLKNESEKIKVISIADVFAKVIDNVYNYRSISSHFIV